MFEFTFQYQNGKTICVSHINKVTYYSVVSEITVAKDKIAQHKFPIDCDLHLFGDNCNNTISCNGLMQISILQED